MHLCWCQIPSVAQGFFLRPTACFYTSLTVKNVFRLCWWVKIPGIWWKTPPLVFVGKCRQFIGKFWCQGKHFSIILGRESLKTPFWKLQRRGYCRELGSSASLRTLYKLICVLLYFHRCGRLRSIRKMATSKKNFFLTGYTYRCITTHLKVKSFPTPQRYALKATFVGDSYTVAIAIIYLGDNRSYSTKILKDNIHQRYCKSIYIFF